MPTYWLVICGALWEQKLLHPLSGIAKIFFYQDHHCKSLDNTSNCFNLHAVLSVRCAMLTASVRMSSVTIPECALFMFRVTSTAKHSSLLCKLLIKVYLHMFRLICPPRQHCKKFIVGKLSEDINHWYSQTLTLSTNTNNPQYENECLSVDCVRKGKEGMMQGRDRANSYDATWAVSATYDYQTVLAVLQWIAQLEWPLKRESEKWN